MPFPLNDPRAEHIVVLMMEKRSFDHMMGLLKGEVDDLRGIAAGDYSNPDTRVL
jgi:phospholipase C